MMKSRRYADRLARKIQREAPTVRVTGLRHENGAYYVDCVDTVIGYPFTVWNPSDWDERKLRREWEAA